MQPKSELELIIEKITPEKRSTFNRLEAYPEYKYLIPLGMENASNEVLDMVFNRYMTLRRSLTTEKKTQLDEIFIASLQPDPYPHPHAKTKLKSRLHLILGKDKIAAFHHIQNSCSSIYYAIGHYQEFGINAGVKLLYAALYELYLGDQRFFNDKTKTRSQVAKEGGVARQDRHLEVKRKACELLNTLTPQEGWPRDLDAFKAILAEVQNYMKENNIRNPVQHNINRTLRNWIKKDPLVSASVRISQTTTYSKPG